MRKLSTLFFFFLMAFIAKAQVITTIAGNGINGYSGDGGPAVNAVLYYPGGLCLDGVGNILFADEGNQHIRKITEGTNIISMVANAAATDVVFDNSGNLYFASPQ